MKESIRFTRVVAIAGMLLATVAMCQAAQVGKAVVRSIKGVADSIQGGARTALKVGQELGPGAVVVTGNDSQVDLFLDQNGPMVRLLENTQLGIDKLSFEQTGVDTVVETQLDLKSGRITGIVKKLSGGSKYEVKTPNGVAGIRGTQYMIGADGAVYVLDGQVVVVYVKSDGSVVTKIVNAGEYFNPATQQVEKMTSEIEADVREQMPTEGVEIAVQPAEPPPVIFISPSTGSPSK